MRTRALISAILLALALGAGIASAQLPAQTPDAAITDGSAQKRLDEARAKWKAQAPRSYRYELRRTCFCPPQKGVTVIVRGGRIVKYPEDLKSVASVPRLFRAIQEAIDDKVVDLDVSYAKRGFPKSLYVDRSQYVADEESGYTVKRFTSLKHRAG